MAKYKKTDERVNGILKCLARGETVIVACHQNGICQRTWEYWIRDDEDLARRCREAKAGPDADVERSLYQQAINGNVTAMIFWLKNRQRDTWRDRHEVGVANKDPVTYIPVWPGIDVEYEADDKQETFVSTSTSVPDPRPN